MFNNDYRFLGRDQSNN